MCSDKERLGQLFLCKEISLLDKLGLVLRFYGDEEVRPQ